MSCQLVRQSATRQSLPEPQPQPEPCVPLSLGSPWGSGTTHNFHTHGRVFSPEMVAHLILASAAAAAASPIRCPVYGMRECAGHGTCVEYDGAYACECDSGRAGEDCAVSLSCDPTASRLPCSGRGVCDGDGICECAPGYAGELCESDLWCPRNLVGIVCSGEVCSAHTCMCRPHRSGVACEQAASLNRVIQDAPGADS